MHNSCKIPGLRAVPSSVNDLTRLPGYKTRRVNQACSRRLFLDLTSLDTRQRQAEMRICHDMKLLEKKLRAEERQLLEPGFSETETSRNMENQTDLDVDLNYYPSLEEADNFVSKIRLESRQRAHRRALRGRSPSTRKRLLRLIPRLCDYNSHRSAINCDLFPCKQPPTYHSLGFRLDDSSTDKWITWSDLKKSKVAGTFPNKPRQEDSGGSSSVGGSGRLQLSPCVVSAKIVKPLDLKNREKLLHKEMLARKKKNKEKKPHDWEVNYGVPLPFKLLRKPVRLHPMEMSTFRG